jgi:CBS domain-containing protein
MNSTVKDVMSTHVIAVRQGAPYKEMAAMLHQQRVSAFPVVDDDNRVVGVVSEADLLTKEALEGTVPRTLLSRQERVRKQVNALTAADLMTKPPVTIGPDEPVNRGGEAVTRHVPNLPFGSSGSGRITSKAHLPTSAPFRVRAAAPVSGRLCGTAGGGPATCPGFPSPYGAPAFASWASWSRQATGPSLPPAYRGRLAASPDPEGFSTFRMREQRPGWAPPRPRGQRCPHDRRKLSGRRLPFLHGQALHPGVHPICRGSG